MPTVTDKNYSRQQVDCAAYSGDLVFDHCNLSQEVPNTGQGTIFINTGALSSIKIQNSNCVNHRQPPLGGVVYENSNISQVDYTLPENQFILVNLGVRDGLRKEMSKVWRWSVQWIVANPTASLTDFKAAFVLNQGSTIFYSETFITFLAAGINQHFPSISTWPEIRDWIAANATKRDMRRII